MDSAYYQWPLGKDEQIDISMYNSDTPVGPHRHDFVEVVFVAQGSCLHEYRGSVMMLIPGDILVISPHETHSYSINAMTLIYNCLFYPEAMGGDYDSLCRINGVRNLFLAASQGSSGGGGQDILHLNPADFAYVESILQKMVAEQNTRGSGYGVVQKANLVCLIAALGRLWDNQFRDNTFYFNEKRNLLAGVLRFIDENHANELNVKQLAAMAYLGPDHFRKVFKEATGLSTVDYINKVRIAKSIALLGDCSLSIGKIAELVGIPDVNYFTRLFRAKLGYTPTEYRRKTKKC